MSINRVYLVGNVTADCKVYEKDGNVSCITFTVAVDDWRKNKETGESENVPGYFRCAVFGNRAAALRNSIIKGVRLAIDGRLRYTTYTKGDEKRSDVSIVCEGIEFMSAKKQPKPDEQEPIPFDM